MLTGFKRFNANERLVQAQYKAYAASKDNEDNNIPRAERFKACLCLVRVSLRGSGIKMKWP
jgi:hypothetical protein